MSCSNTSLLDYFTHPKHLMTNSAKNKQKANKQAYTNRHWSCLGVRQMPKSGWFLLLCVFHMYNYVISTVISSPERTKMLHGRFMLAPPHFVTLFKDNSCWQLAECRSTASTHTHTSTCPLIVLDTVAPIISFQHTPLPFLLIAKVTTQLLFWN